MSDKIRPIDKAFEVKMPNEGKENLYSITVLVKAYNAETALIKFGEADLYGDKFSVVRVVEGEDEDGNVCIVPHSPKSDKPN